MNTIEELVRKSNQVLIFNEALDILKTRRLQCLVNILVNKINEVSILATKRPREDQANICRLYTEELMPSTKISELYNCSQPLITKILRENGIKVRTQAEAQALRREKRLKQNA